MTHNTHSIVEKYGKFIVDNFSIESIVLGNGEFSAVHLARNKTTKELAAVKVVDLENYPHQFIAELRALSACKHDNVAVFHGFRLGRTSATGYLFIEYLPFPTLESFILNSKNGFPERKALLILEQLTSAVGTLHRHGISHHDLKPDNILMNAKTRQVKIIDFGLSVSFSLRDPIVNHPSGTPLFLPPEVLEDKPHDPRYADVWSLGVILHFMLCQEHPWSQDLNEEALLAAMKSTPVDLRRFSPQIQAILRGTLALVPSQRVSTSELLKMIRDALPEKIMREIGSEPATKKDQQSLLLNKPQTREIEMKESQKENLVNMMPRHTD